MDIEWLRDFCLSLPHTTEQIQWEDALVFKVGGKMYAVLRLEPGPVWLSLKCGTEEFAELTERQGVIPAPYLARANWVSLTLPVVLPRAEIERLARGSYDLVFSQLPRKTQLSLERTRAGRPGKGKARRKRET
jgi:predicted DNA-binding protein (MmcQ/YjbR family)